MDTQAVSRRLACRLTREAEAVVYVTPEAIFMGVVPERSRDRVSTAPCRNAVFLQYPDGMGDL